MVIKLCDNLFHSEDEIFFRSALIIKLLDKWEEMPHISFGALLHKVVKTSGKELKDISNDEFGYILEMIK